VKISNIYKKTKASMYTLALSAFCSPIALADGLPKAPGADNDAGKEGFTGTATNYVMDGLVLLLLLMAAWGLIRVAQNILSTYGEISDGKATYRELGGSVIVGLVILSIVIYLLVEAASVFGITV
jgi:integrating conjugative element membrane protein (TIGR03745 family)